MSFFSDDEEIIDFCVDFLVNYDNDDHPSELEFMANQYLDSCH